MNKKVYIIIGVLALAAIILLALNSKKNSGLSNLLTKNPNATSLNKTDLPEGFPKGFPVDVTATITKDGGIQTDGQKQINLRFVSNFTVEQALVVYSDYFEKQGWQVLSKLNEPLAKSIVAKNNAGDVMTLNLGPDKNNKTAVNVSLIKAK